MAAKTITVKIRYGITHDGVEYHPGSTFECPTDVYDALKECFDLRGADAPEMPEDTSGSGSTGGDAGGDAGDDITKTDRYKLWDRKTKDEIKAELTTRSVVFPDDGTKRELIEILLDAEAQ